jgi:proteic killer suppression protein
MRIVFAKDSLARILTDQAHKMGLPFTVIKGARKTLIKLESAELEEISNLGGLDYKILKGDIHDTRQFE